MRALLIAPLVLLFLPFTLIGALAEFARFGFSCGIDIGKLLLEKSFTKGGAK